MKKKGRFYFLLAGQIIGICIVFGFIFINGTTLERWLEGEVTFVYQPQECDLRNTPCSLVFENGATMKLSIAPQGIPLMTPLALTLQTTGIEASHLTLKVYATNMDMGVHRFTFTQQEEGLYQATGVLPTCIAGNMHWHAEVILEKQTNNQRVGGQFRFKTK